MKPSNSQPRRFKITVPILKTRVAVSKNDDGEEEEVRFISGVASSTDKDAHGDRMGKEALVTMAASLNRHIVNLNSDHDTGWSSDMGEISSLSVSEDDLLVMEARLNKMSKSNDLWYALTEANKQLGLSIGGFVREYEMVKEAVGEGIEWVRTYKDIELDHIAITSTPANPTTWVSAIAKSLKNSDNEAVLIKEAEDTGKESLIILNTKTEMKKKDASLEAEEVKAEESEDTKTEVVSTDEKVEESATPDNEPSSEVVKEDDEVESVKSEEEDKTESEDETEEIEGKSENEEEEVEETVEEKVEEEAEKSDKEDEVEDEADVSKDLNSGYAIAEVAKSLQYVISYMEYKEKDASSLQSLLESLKGEAASELKEKEEVSKSDFTTLTNSIEALNSQMKDVIKTNFELVERNEQLTKQVGTLSEEPAGRKESAELTKKVGDSGAELTDEERKSEMEAGKLPEINDKSANDPYRFPKIQAVRRKYK